ncbi:MAG TPA: MFS transporter [Candidatus Dormibacteraeota bacterium]|nr:MFS transporter [Candidatus Dormibacteraeota bacterium]
MRSGSAGYALALMVAINFLNYADRWVASAAAPQIQRDFHLSDFQVGLLGTAFLLVYAIGAIPFGYWADRGLRRTVIATGVAVWSCATVFSGLVTSYLQLFIARAVLGVGEAGYYPAGASLLSDHFPRERRGRAMSIWNAGSVLGIAAGFAGGGLIAARYGWRTAFFLAAIPGLVLALLAYLMREPLRGAAEAVGPRLRRAREATPGSLLRLLRIPTLRWLIVAHTLLYFVLAANAFWLPTVLGRRFGLSLGAAGLLSGAVLVVGGLIGTLLGGWIGDRLSHRRPTGPLEVGIAGFAVAAGTIVVALLGPMSLGGVPVFVPAFFVTVVCVYLYQGPFTAVAQNVVTPGLRAGAVALLLLIAHVLGDSHSTADVGFLSDQLHSLPLALLLTSVPLLLLAAGAAALGLRTVEADMRAMEERWALERDKGNSVPALAP